jgi:saccharopepsin
VYDTGSGNLLVPGSNCRDKACKVHRQFDRSKSSTGRAVSCDGKNGPARDQVTITFGTGEVSGTCWQDSICLGPGVCSKGDLILSTHESASPFAEFHFDGVQGLALPEMSQGGDFNLMTTMQRHLKVPIFSVFLSDSDDEESHVTFGAVNQELLLTDLYWVPVERNSGYWEVKIKDIAISNKAQDLCKNCNVAVDTGTSELAGPSEVISRMQELLEVDADCRNFESMPKLGFIMGDRVLNLDAYDYIDKASGSCRVAFMPLDVPPPQGPLFVLGIPFLQKFYTAYDSKERKVGFGLAKHVGRGIKDAASFLAMYQ